MLTADDLRQLHTSTPEVTAPADDFAHDIVPVSDPIRPRQSSLIRDLLAEREGNPEAETIRERLNYWRSIGGITRAGASQSITKLLAIPKNTATATAPATPATPAGQSHTEVWPGLYTVETPERHYTFQVAVQRTDDDFAPGQTILSLLTGPDNTSDYTQLGFVKGGKLRVWRSRKDLVSPAVQAAVDAFLANPEDALEAKHCIRCNAVLTVPASVAAGIGPECIKKGW